MYFLFNRTTLQVFVTYLILVGALYVHPLWFYKHQHDNLKCILYHKLLKPRQSFRITPHKRQYNANILRCISPSDVGYPSSLVNGSQPVQICAEISVILSDRVRRNLRKGCSLCHCDIPYVWQYEIWSCKKRGKIIVIKLTARRKFDWPGGGGRRNERMFVFTVILSLLLLTIQL